jgi:hypothetical protein
MASIGDRLQTARSRRFVGRSDEVERFRTVLTAEVLPLHVLHVFGPGGVGKTELLQAFARCCDEEGHAAYYLDAHDVDPSPEAFRGALRDAVGVDADTSVLAALDERANRTALLIDSYETVNALDGWLRTQFLPDLPDDALVVLAGRTEPHSAWRADSGWGPLVETMPLRNLDGTAGRALLERRGVPEDQHETILNFTHGHPLALSLVADLLDQRDDQTFEPESAPDVVKTLLERFVQKVPSPAHRATLETASLVRYTTEPLLSSVLDQPNAHDLFGWLRGLSFVQPGDRGGMLHALAREALSADLRWRNPDWHDTLHTRIRQHYVDRLKRTPDRGVPDALSDLTYLLRRHPLIEPFYTRLQSQWDDAHGLIEDAPREDDWDALVDMVARHEGAAAAEWAEHWFERQPDGVRVYRAANGAPEGFMLTLSLDEADADARSADPVTDAVWRHLEAHTPLRAGERASLFRFWMARETYQAVSPVQSLIFIRQVRHYLQTPALAHTALVCRDPDTWGDLFAYAGMERLDEDGVSVGDHTFALYAHDWRAQPPAQWLDQLAERGFSTGGDSPETDEDRVIVLSRPDFEEALREAFKDLHRPDQLRDTPLLYSRVVTGAVGPDADVPDRIEALRSLLEETAERLADDPRDEKYHRAVHRTYIQPAPTQEKAAEQLGVPFSTFRRHLNKGLDRVADVLWEREVGVSA